MNNKLFLNFCFSLKYFKLLHNCAQPNNELITSLSNMYNFGVSKITNENVNVIGIIIVYQPINLFLLELVTYFYQNYVPTRSL